MFHHRDDPEYNVREIAIIGDLQYVVPRDCQACGEFWKVTQQDDGARYFVEGRWLCSACAQKKNADRY